MYEFASVALTVRLKLPAAVGVPVTAPVAKLPDSPAGNAPAVAGSVSETQDFGVAPTARLQPSTQLTCAAGLTLAQASIHTRSASQWRGHAIPVDNRTPAVFAIGG